MMLYLLQCFNMATLRTRSRSKKLVEQEFLGRTDPHYIKELYIDDYIGKLPPVLFLYSTLFTICGREKNNRIGLFVVFFSFFYFFVGRH